MKSIVVCRNERLFGFELEAPPHVQIHGTFRFDTLLCPLGPIHTVQTKMRTFHHVKCTIGVLHYISEHDTQMTTMMNATFQNVTKIDQYDEFIADINVIQI